MSNYYTVNLALCKLFTMLNFCELNFDTSFIQIWAGIIMQIAHKARIFPQNKMLY